MAMDVSSVHWCWGYGPGSRALPLHLLMVLFTFRFTGVFDMMLPFFWLILLVLPWVDTSVNSTSVGDNSTSRLENSTTGLDTAIQPRQGKYGLKTPSVLDGWILHLELTRVITRLVWNWAHQNQITRDFTHWAISLTPLLFWDKVSFCSSKSQRLPCLSHPCPEVMGDPRQWAAATVPNFNKGLQPNY